MKLLVPIALLTCALFSLSCEQKSTVKKTGNSEQTVSSEGKWHESEFTPWMSRAELQFKQENNPADQYFAYVEGRSHQGQNEYRAVIKPFPGDQYDQWAVFWGISETELFEWELRLLRTGFTRESVQTFVSTDSKPLFQIVWLKNKDQTETPEWLAAHNNPVIAGQSTLIHEPTPQVSEPEIVNELPQNQPESAVVEITEPPKEPTPAVVPQETVPVAKTVKPEEPVKKAPKSEAPAVSKKELGKGPIYVVKPGDTLSKISRLKGVSVTELKQANGLRSDHLRIGQKLAVPQKAKR